MGRVDANEYKGRFLLTERPRRVPARGNLEEMPNLLNYTAPPASYMGLLPCGATKWIIKLKFKTGLGEHRNIFFNNFVKYAQ